MVYRRASSELKLSSVLLQRAKALCFAASSFFALLFCADTLNSILFLEGDQNWSTAIVNLPCIGSFPVVLCNKKSHCYLFNNANAVRGEHVSCRVHGGNN